jgi:hypothetical protein
MFNQHIEFLYMARVHKFSIHVGTQIVPLKVTYLGRYMGTTAA